MNKLLLATALILSCSAPALAASEKAPVKPEHRQAETRIERSSHALGGSSSEAADPYWTPCHYSTKWGANSCD